MISVYKRWDGGAVGITDIKGATCSRGSVRKRGGIEQTERGRNKATKNAGRPSQAFIILITIIIKLSL